MANKVGTNKIFVRILLAGVLLAFLLVGALLSVFYYGDGKVFILIALVVIPALGLVAMYCIQFSWLFVRDKVKIDDGDFFVPPLSSDKTIIIYGNEFADPYYKQLTMPNFEGKPLPKRKKSKSTTARTKSNNRPAYIDYHDKFNGVAQSQMSFDNWVDVLRDEPKVEQNERKAELVGELTQEVLSQYRDEIQVDTLRDEGAILLPAWDETNKGKVFSTHRAESLNAEVASVEIVAKTEQKKRRTSKKIAETGNKLKSSVGAVILTENKSVKANSGAKPARVKKILIHKKPKVDKRDDYVFETLPKADTNQPIKSLLNEQFEYFSTNTTHSASQELLNKMRREDIRR